MSIKALVTEHIRIEEADRKIRQRRFRLQDKLAYATGEMVESHEEKGRFVLITENDEGVAQIATDMSLAEVFLILDVIKYSLLANPEQTTIH